MKKKILGIFVCMLFIAATVLPVAGTLNENKTKVEKKGIIDSQTVTGTNSGTDWWTMFRHDPQHSGYSTSAAPITNHRLWEYGTGGAEYDFLSSPAVFDYKVYVGVNENLYCLNATTTNPSGYLEWSYQTNEVVNSSPAIYEGKVYFCDDFGSLYCLDAKTGTWIWETWLWGFGQSSPTVVDDKVYVGSDDRSTYRFLWCIDADTGDFIWLFTTNYPGVSSPAVSDGYVYFSDAQNVYCLPMDDPDGSTVIEPDEVIWTEPIPASVSSPAVADGYVYIGSDNGRVYCLNASTGDHEWLTQKDVYASSPAVADGYVFIGSEDHNMYCLYADSGQTKWTQPTTGPIFSSPAVADGKVYFGVYYGKTGGSYNTEMFCLNATTGNEIWRWITGNPIISSPAVALGNVYIITYDLVMAFGSYPDIDITHITGGLGVTAVIKNNGNGSATDVEWRIGAHGGLLGLVDEEENDTIPRLDPGESQSVSTGIFLGFGPISIYATADDAGVEKRGTQIIIFTLIR